MKKNARNERGFTIVELLIVVVVIGVLAAIVIVAYNGITASARISKVQQDMSAVNKQILLYEVQNGSYPVTGGSMGSGGTVYMDSNCPLASGTVTAQWVPGLGVSLPQSDQELGGIGNGTGCYMYMSNGTDYVLSAWNVLPSPSTDTGYRRLGFRETTHSPQYYLCNHVNIGGGSYNINNDYYKRSVTYTNITSCNETPPAGA